LSTAAASVGAPRALLLGATSVVGFSLAQRFSALLLPIANPHNRAADGHPWHRARLDEPAEWLPLLQTRAPDLVIYAHAVCDVGKCEQYPEWARRVNVDCLAAVLDSVPASTRFVYLSSDHVFGGDGTYSETSSPTPISVYGRTRVDAEQLVLQRPGSLIIRFGLPIGRSLNGRTGFYDWLRYRYERQLPITVIRDEWRSAAHADDVAQRVFELAQAPIGGIRHITATRAVARPELATHLMNQQGLPARFSLQNRADQPYPHLGRVELTSDHGDELASALASVVP